jgi:hypothetical protein
MLGEVDENTVRQSIRDTDTGVDDPIQDVNEEVANDDEGCCQEENKLNHWEVSSEHRLDEQIPNPRPVKHDFQDNKTTDRADH